MFDYIALEILRLFEENGYSEGYIEEKKERFKNQNRFQMLLWCNNLDDDNLKLLANNLKVDLDSFMITIRTLRKL